MGKVIEFPEEAKMSPDDLKLLIEENEILKYVLKVMNHIPLNDKYEDGTEVIEKDINYEELWNRVSLNKKLDIGKQAPEAISLYYQILTCGYDNFGIKFFDEMATSPENAPIFYSAIKGFLDFMTDFSEEQSNRGE